MTEQTIEIGHRRTESRRRQRKREKGQFATHAAIMDTACFLHSQQANNSFVWCIRRKHNNCIIVLDLTLCIRRRVRMYFSGRQNHRKQGRNFLFLAHITHFHALTSLWKPKGWKGEGIMMFWNSLDDQTMSIDRPSISKYESVLNKIQNQTKNRKRSNKVKVRHSVYALSMEEVLLLEALFVSSFFVFTNAGVLLSHLRNHFEK